jgi:LemA protein
VSISWVLIILLAIVLIVAIGLIVSYNRFVRQRNLVRESWRQIDVELQRRHDLIPNLVETVKGYAGQERTVLIAVTEARAQAEQVRRDPNAGAAQQAVAENNLGRAVTGLFATVEAYPDLKSNQNFLALQQQLAETEDRVAAGRRFYNANVRGLNTRVEAFPSNLVAGAFHFEVEEYFEVDDPVVRASVAVDFGELGSGGGVGSTAPAPPAPPSSTPAAPSEQPPPA